MTFKDHSAILMIIIAVVASSSNYTFSYIFKSDFQENVPLPELGPKRDHQSKKKMSFIVRNVTL